MTTVVENVPDIPSDLRQMLMVGPELLNDVWPAAVPLLLAGKKYWEDWATIDSIYNSIRSDTMQLWLMNDDEEFILAMLTNITNNAVYKTIWILWVGGKELNIALERFFDYFELWASRLGVSRVKMSGRLGWARKLLPHGYELTQYVVEKDISGIREH